MAPSETDESSRTGKDLFVDGVNLTYALTAPADGAHGRGIQISADQEVLIQNNTMSGWEATPDSPSINTYCIVKHNSFTYVDGYMTDSATYAFVENNTVTAYEPQASVPSHGINVRSDAYVYYNTVSGFGYDDPVNNGNDGEAVNAEVPGATFNQGSVTAASGNVITVNAELPLTQPSLSSGYLCMIITDGRGVGQIRTATVSSSSTITLSSPFKITPDSSSKFTLITPNANLTVYDNMISNCAKGIWVYRGGFDDVVTMNTMSNTRGILISGLAQNITNGANASAPSYYVRVYNNHLTGVSPRTGFGGIDVASDRSGQSSFENIQVLGVDIASNYVSASNTVGAGKAGESYNQDGIVLSPSVRQWCRNGRYHRRHHRSKSSLHHAVRSNAAARGIRSGHH